MITIRSKEESIKEIKSISEIENISLLDAILQYIEKYDLDYDYFSKNILTDGLYQKLKVECENKNMIKVYDEPDNLGI